MNLRVNRLVRERIKVEWDNAVWKAAEAVAAEVEEVCHFRV